MDEQVRELYRAVLIYGLKVRVFQQKHNEYVIYSFKDDDDMMANILAKAGMDVASVMVKNLRVGEYVLTPGEEE